MDNWCPNCQSQIDFTSLGCDACEWEPGMDIEDFEDLE